MSLLSVLLLSVLASAKIYERCELAKELKEVHEVSWQQLPTWVCIAEHESQYNTSAIGHVNGDGSGDHGIFQISDLFWCSPPGNGWACGMNCAQLTDENIEDDFICARRIYREHKRLSGDGFNAWAVYQPFCRGNVDRYIDGCFNRTEAKLSTAKPPTTKISSTTGATAITIKTTGGIVSRSLSHGKVLRETKHRFIFKRSGIILNLFLSK